MSIERLIGIILLIAGGALAYKYSGAFLIVSMLGVLVLVYDYNLGKKVYRIKK